MVHDAHLLKKRCGMLHLGVRSCPQEAHSARSEFPLSGGVNEATDRFESVRLDLPLFLRLRSQHMGVLPYILVGHPCHSNLWQAARSGSETIGGQPSNLIPVESGSHKYAHTRPP